MMAKPVILRRAARIDLENAVDYYTVEAGEVIAGEFADTYILAIGHIATHPDSGASRYSEILSLPGLRFWPLKRFPYLMFYTDEADHIEVWRILHSHRDMSEELRPTP